MAKRTIEGCTDERLVVVAYRQIINTHTLQPDVYIAVVERRIVLELLDYIIRHSGSSSQAYDDMIALFS